MGRGELENRDAEETGAAGLPSLGELDEEHAEERGELDSYSTRQLTSDVPADMVVQATDAAQAKRTGIGSPKVDYDVRSIYDSRPLNGRDFNLWFTSVLTDEIATFNPLVLLNMWMVPQGLVAVIRGFTIIQDPGEDLGIFDGEVALLVDQAVKEPPTVLLGPLITNNLVEQTFLPYRSGEEIETFIVVDALQSVGLDWRPTDPAVVPGAEGQFVRFGFRGNFLQKTGVPANMQVCNKAGQAYTADTLAPDFGPSGADFLKRRRKGVDPYSTIPLVNTPK